jgi:succinate-semialdehyde dehydrogenase/glutarate-semialdehyde dehydrogenase
MQDRIEFKIPQEALIDGQWVAERGERRFRVHSPASGEVVGQVADCGWQEAQWALNAATAALGPWQRKTAAERAAVLMRWHALLKSHRDELARLISVEQGKPLAESLGEVDYGAAYVQWFAEEARRAYGHVIPEPVPGRKLMAIPQGIGVVAVITPWNFPLAMLARKVAPALAAGCTVVSRPAEDTPLTALAIADLALRAGVPPGVFNVVPSSRDNVSDVTSVWLRDPRVRKVSFTGSTAVGKHIARECTATLKKVSLELGGNAPFIVFDDADLDAAVAGALAAKFRNSGQTCVCPNRFLVQDSVHDEFARRLAEAVSRLRPGDPLSPQTTQAPLINERAVDKVEQNLAQAVAAGARILVGGKRASAGPLFFQPTILTDVTPDMVVAQEEIFGPVATLLRFGSEDEAIRIANASPYGLAAYFYARDVGRVWRVAQALEAGMVGINEGLISTEVAPFGGVKESGQGREGSYLGLADYMETKYVCMGGLAA